MSEIPLAPPEPTATQLSDLQALIKRYCGLRLDTGKLTFSLQRAWPTLAAMGIQDINTLITELGFMAGRAWVKLVPFLTINETYFLRENGQLSDFMTMAVPELQRNALARGESGLKLLSAACSTGEEAFTLAMLMSDAGQRAKVTAVDIDPDALEKAEGAIYGPNSFRGVEAAWRDKHFETVGPNAWWVRPAYRELVSFKRLNLLQAASGLAPARFDAIFCRNVLIYFDRPTQLAVIDQLRSLLVPGGYLCLGHSEMFFDVDLGLESISTPRATIYRRREA